MKRLEERAKKVQEDEASQITTGKPGEEVIQTFEVGNIQFVQLPDDEQGIVRISVGGGDHLNLSRPINYCNFRGDPGKVIKLLKRCLAGMRQAQ
jgi:hypothetical protein